MRGLSYPARRRPYGLELSCRAEAGNSPVLYGSRARTTSVPGGPARRVTLSELLGGQLPSTQELNSGNVAGVEIDANAIDSVELLQVIVDSPGVSKEEVLF